MAELSPITTPDIKRPPKELCDALREIGSATCAGELNRLGIRQPTITGPKCYTPDLCVAGPALTLRFMPRREDKHPVGEYAGPERQLHRQVLLHTQPGDIVVVDACGNMYSGVFGEMMLTFFKGRGGAGVVIDGCIRDYPDAKTLGLGLWLKGTTPNFHVQHDVFPVEVNGPVACGGVYVEPGDIIVADEDGVVCVPVALAPELVEKAGAHREWEVFTKMKLLEGGDLRKYYPLNEDGQKEYEEWKKQQGK